MTKIKVAVFDVDGTLTPADVLYIDGGKRARFFNVRDGYGIKMLQDSGIQVWCMSGEDDEHIFDRMEKLDVEFKLGIPDKRNAFGDGDFPSVDKSEIAWMGDDLNDLECMRMIGLPGCPADATRTVRDFVTRADGGFLSSRNGGHGAVREFCEYILSNNFLVKENEPIGGLA